MNRDFSRLLAAALVVAGITNAVASPLGEALARHSERDVTTLRDRKADAAARCTLGAVYAQRNDLSRASLYLAGCDEVELPAEIASDVSRIARDLKKKLRDSDLAMIEVVTNPTGMTATIDALPGDPFTTPATLFLAPGEYQVTATLDSVVLKNVVHAVKRSRGAVVLDAGGRIVAGKIVKDGNVDFSEEGGGGGDQHAGPPPAVKHKNMMATKYQRGMAASTSEPNPNALDDPFAVHETRRTPRAYWLGVRLGGGMFDDGASVARAGVAVAATGRLSLAGKTFLAGRLDWSRRGGEGQTGIDVVGASAGAGVTVIETPAVAIAVIAQLRGDLRLASTRTMSMVDVPVSRAGATVAGGVELALTGSPVTVGARFEQGLTMLIPGARDRAVLFELGVDWR